MSRMSAFFLLSLNESGMPANSSSQSGSRRAGSSSSQYMARPLAAGRNVPSLISVFSGVGRMICADSRQGRNSVKSGISRKCLVTVVIIRKCEWSWCVCCCKDVNLNPYIAVGDVTNWTTESHLCSFSCFRGARYMKFSYICRRFRPAGCRR